VIAIVCDWGGDLSVGPGGDIAVAPVQTEIQQRLVRRLLTNAGDYIWHTDYGAGLGDYVGETYSSNLIEGTISSQLQYESLISVSPPPSIQISQSSAGDFSTTSVTVQYQVVGTFTGTSTVLGLTS
jgi:hypothetical protein